MSEFEKRFNERLMEIEGYIAFLSALERQAQSGPPRIGGDDGTTVTVQQQRILYSSVYLQLYNLVESTATQCIQELINAVKTHRVRPDHLSLDLRREWVRFAARTNIDLNSENRLKAALELCDSCVSGLPISKFDPQMGGGGNWDDKTFEDTASRLGISLNVQSKAYSDAKRPFKNELGALAYIKALRNDLAHGSISFAECGQDISVSDLTVLTARTAEYLRDVLKQFERFICAQEFVLPDWRAAVAVV